MKTYLNDEQKKTWRLMLSTYFQYIKSKDHYTLKKPYFDDIAKWNEKYTALMAEKLEILQKKY